MMHLRCDCGRTLGYEARHAGKTVRCPGCERLHVVPGAEEAPAKPESLPVQAAPPGILHAVGELLHTAQAFAILCVLAAIGVGLIGYGIHENKASSGATDVPRPVTCQTLIDGGGADNPHVLVTDVLLGEKYFTLTQAADRPWTTVYLPLIPLTPELRTRLARGEPFVTPATNLRVVLVSYTIKNKEDMARIFTPEGHIQGMVVNSVRSLGSEAENKLRQAYPGSDLNKVILLELGRKPTSQSFLIALFAGGGVLILIAAALGLVALVVRRWSTRGGG